MGSQTLRSPRITVLIEMFGDSIQVGCPMRSVNEIFLAAGRPPLPSSTEIASAASVIVTPE
jgi:hypothetical protein